RGRHRARLHAPARHGGAPVPARRHREPRTQRRDRRPRGAEGSSPDGRGREPRGHLSAAHAGGRGARRREPPTTGLVPERIGVGRTFTFFTYKLRFFFGPALRGRFGPLAYIALILIFLPSGFAF